MTAPELQTLAQVFTERMLNTAPEGMVLAGMVWALLRLIGRQNSGARFAIWFLALLAIVALPFFAGCGFGTANSPMMAPVNLPREIILSSSWANCLLAAWAVGSALSLVRLSVGLWRVRSYRSHCSEVDLASLDPAIAAILREFASSRRVELCVSSDVASPAAIGFFRPAIVFPAWLLPQLSAGEIEVILLHENAHLRRWDHWTNLAQKFLKAVFFFHPAVWWIENRLTLEREMACDDMVLAQSTSPRIYASFLITFAEKLQNARGLALVQALVSRTRQMTLRVAQILDSKQPHRTGLWKPVLGVGAGLLAVVFGVAPSMPRVVTFQNVLSQGQSTQMQATKKKEARPVAVIAAEGLNRALAVPVMRRLALAPQPRAIPAAFNQRTAVVPMRLKATSQAKPVVMRAKAAQKELPSQETYVVLQTTQYDSSGSGVWTLCIWRIEGGNSAETQLESAILLTI
jgi:beta-lactamase regulating signal transducer with metallopeptidase domain